jgi:hypothetical protein
LSFFFDDRGDDNPRGAFILIGGVDQNRCTPQLATGRAALEGLEAEIDGELPGGAFLYVTARVGWLFSLDEEAIIRCLHGVHLRSCARLTALRPVPGEHYCVMVMAEFRGSTDKSAQKWAEVCCGPQRDSGWHRLPIAG